MNDKVEILTKVYSYVNQIKVYLALKDIAGIWKVVNELSEYIVSVDCSPTELASDGAVTLSGVDLAHGKDITSKSVYCRNCDCFVGFGEMKPYRKDDDTVDMLCNGCDAVLVEGE